jgi:hypothetical protein
MAFYVVRLNAMDFRDFEDMVSCGITVLQNVTFHRTLLDRFLVAFQEQVARNAIYVTTEVSFKCNYIILYFIKCYVEYDIFIIIYLKNCIQLFFITVKSWDFHVTWAFIQVPLGLRIMLILEQGL